MGTAIIAVLEIAGNADVPIAPGNKVSGVEVTEVTTTAYTVSTTSNREKIMLIVRLDTIGAACTITIPTALFSRAGLEIEIIDADQQAGTYNITVSPAGSETINGETSMIIEGDGTSATLRRISITELVLR